jgi:DDE family transposase
VAFARTLSAAGAHLTPGEAADCTAFEEVIALAEERPAYLLADKGYDSDAIRASLHEAGIRFLHSAQIQSQGQNPLEQAHVSRAQPHAHDRSPEDQPRYRHAI